jgi:hypothetical protein
MNLTGIKFGEILRNRQLSFYACLTCVFILPLYIHLIPPFIILWVVFWILENRGDFNKIPVNGSKPAYLFFLFLLLFLWQIAGLFFADSLSV